MILSVIIPVYNAAPYLAECLESILAQLPKEAEVICVDDGSTDNSAAILESFARREVRIKILHQANAGQSAARNRGLQQAQGDFIYFADADDALTGNYTFSQLIEVMTRDNLDVLFFDAVTQFDTPELASSSSIRPRWYIRTHQYPFVYTGPDLFTQFIENREFTVVCPLMFLRRTFLYANNLYFQEGIFHEDNIFVLHTILAAQRAGHRAWKFYLRKVHGDSVMTRKPTVRHLRGRLANYQDVVDLLQQTKWSKEVRAALNNRLKLYLKRLVNMLPELLPEYENQLTAAERQIAHQVLLSIPKKPSSRAKPRTFIGRIFKCFHDEGFWYTLKRMVVLGKKDSKKLLF